MKKNIMIGLLVFICIIGSVLIIGQRRDGEETVPSSQVNEARRTFSSLLNKRNIESFGLKNIDQFKALKQGKQYNKYMIELNDLKNYIAGNDPDSIIKALPLAEVTLTGNSGEIITSIEFIKEDDKWKPTGFGLTPELIALSNTQLLLNDSVGGNTYNGRLVIIPALHTYFIAVTGTEGLDFVVLEDNQNLGYKQGETVPASEALLKLSRIADTYNGLPD